MKALSYLLLRRSEAGVALLISIFVLMLISVMALSLILASGTETALAGNYRSSAIAYYAALAGLDEGRGRLLPKNPNYLGPALPSPFPLNKVLYILNPAPGEVVSPTDPPGSPRYPDTEYNREFPVPGLAGAAVTPITSVSPVAGLPPALYKWVRINAITEASLKLPVSGNQPLDSTTPLYYDLQDANCKPLPRLSLTVGSCPSSSTAVQALEITSFAALPDGSQKLMQYVVAPVSSNLNIAPPGTPGQSIPSALTLVGNNVQFTGPSGPNSAQFRVDGHDQCGDTAGVYGIGYTNSITSLIPPGNEGSYSGAGKASPNVIDVTNSLPPNLQTPSGLDSLVQTITQNADVVIPAGQTPASQNVLPSGMSAGNPMTVVVKGNFDLGGNATGFGVLVVTGNFSYEPNASWKGVILVIGQGAVTSSDNGNGNGRIDGAILVAQTRDSSGNLLPDPNLGSSSFVVTGNQGGLGIYYSSCWVKAVQTPSTFKILSYRQISLQ